MIPAPTRPEDRIDAIDIVRGFVLFGVLIVNAWGTLAGPPITNPNRVDWILNRLINGFFNYRSMATFSLLFGLGLAMQSDKARADGSSFGTFLLRRQGALLLIGVLHVLLFWNGDVLMTYAIIGLVLMPLLKAPRKVLAFCSAFLFIAYELIITDTIKAPAVLMRASDNAVFDRSNTMSSAYATGSWGQAASLRIHEWMLTFGGYRPFAFEIMAFFIAGVLVWRSGVFQSPATHRKAIREIVQATFWISIASTAVLEFTPASLVMRIPPWFLPFFKHLYFGSIPVMVAWYVFGILHLTQKPAWRKALGFLAPIGRMALTNYLMQSAVGVTVFCGWGFGRWGLWHIWQIAIYAIVLFVAQAVLSRWWLRRFQYGPAEWLWRSVTYGACQPLRRLHSTAYESFVLQSTRRDGASLGS